MNPHQKLLLDIPINTVPFNGSLASLRRVHGMPVGRHETLAVGRSFSFISQLLLIETHNIC